VLLNFWNGSIAGFQRPLSGCDSRGSVGLAHDHTSITRESVAVRK